MSVTIELEPETERRLTELARQENLTIEAYIVRLIERHLEECARIELEKSNAP